MDMPLNLENFWEARAVTEPDWFKHRYEVALDCIDDDHVHDDDPYIVAPNAQFDLLVEDNTLRDLNGPEYTPEELRHIAFELLVLADLAEME